MSARKIGLLILILAFGASVETAWQVRGDWRVGPEGCRVIGGRFYGPSYSFEQTAERAVPAGAALRLEARNARNCRARSNVEEDLVARQRTRPSVIQAYL